MITKTSVCSQKNENFFPSNSLRGSSTLQHQQKTTKITKSFEKTQIQIKNQLIDDLLKVYGWRSKTELPIAKIMFYKVASRNPNEQFTTVQVSYQSFPITLSDLKQICLDNILYLLKESFIGFEKLYSVFGSFLISNKMIGLNKNNRCKVWINQNLSINQPIDIQMFKNLSQKQFIKQILTIFEKKAQKIKKIQYLFEQLVHCQKFQEIVTLIDIFARKNQIEIGSSYKSNQYEERRNNVSKSPIKNVNNMTNHSFIANGQNKGAPKFLNKSQINDNNTNRSNIIDQRDKSKSVTKNNIRNKTPLANDRSQKVFYNPLKTQMKTSSGFPQKQTKQLEKKNSNDYSFELKKEDSSSSPNHKYKPKYLATSSNSLSNQDVEDIFQGKSIINTKNINHQIDVKKSDLNTTYTNNSAITNRNKNFLLQKKTSLFDDDQDRNMIESIVAGEQPRRSLHSTFDLQKLGKMGKTVGESYMPEDFNK